MCMLRVSSYVSRPYRTERQILWNFGVFVFFCNHYPSTIIYFYSIVKKLKYFKKLDTQRCFILDENIIKS